jgi:predicted glycoside hydrolase/deacetylase ChbG (UPF0249 family)
MDKTTLEAINQERERQIEQWGGPEHDDTHGVWEWFNLIYRQIAKAAKEPQDFRIRMIKIAALAIAAAESAERNS